MAINVVPYKYHFQGDCPPETFTCTDPYVSILDHVYEIADPTVTILVAVKTPPFPVIVAVIVAEPVKLPLRVAVVVKPPCVKVIEFAGAAVQFTLPVETGLIE